MKSFLVPAAAFLVIATAAVAQPDGNADAGSAQNKTTARSDEKGEQLICRWVNDPDVGSLVQGRTRRCLTAEQWRAQRR